MAKSGERALVECTRRGWPAGTVERSVPTGGNQFIRTRIDLFHFADIIAMDGGNGSLAIQACMSDVASHMAKIADEPEIAPLAVRWLSTGNRLELWSFRKLKVKRGGKAFRWTLRRVRAHASDGRIAWAEMGEGT